ncbi:OLC1v1034227C1 [Oldenlandia corymbosa var. corymbosa]|uniref:OLC1v1034227C1 n=1 Tax=Oldenlandia corymbosa var. corymbosa TaxID=529605 RepID=A0AAV1CQV5_OLDCO|nr:OLC1v1034227C1 [Oldenlandia corymbosa var. corymbosa]
MAAGTTRKISAASARAHTRKSKQKSSIPCLPSGVLKKVLVVFFIGLFAWVFQAARPPPPKTCGSPNGPPVTAPRIKLSDGRHLAYKEVGVAKDKAKYKVVFVHGFDSCRHDMPPLSQDTAETLGIYVVAFDRPGYGESDPHSNRTLSSMASDVEELADKLGLGSKFYLVGFSLGGQALWPCIKYIPHRLAGAALLAPVTNYWWRGFPSNLSSEAFKKEFLRDQWGLRVAHYAPWLTYWWTTQKLFPRHSVVVQSPEVLSAQDLEIVTKFRPVREYEAQVRQQGEFESLCRDLIIGFGNWEFEPMDLENPFPNNEGSVHIFQGDEDMLVPASLQRYIAEKLPWIHYHELPGAGHMFPLAEGMMDNIVKTLTKGE